MNSNPKFSSQKKARKTKDAKLASPYVRELLTRTTTPVASSGEIVEFNPPEKEAPKIESPKVEVSEIDIPEPPKKPKTEESGSKQLELKKALKKQVRTAVLLGHRSWNPDEAVGGVSGERILSCVIFHLNYSKDKWWVPRLNKGRGFIKSGDGKIARLLDESVPEDFVYNPDGVIEWRAKNIEGTEDRYVKKYIRRKPRNDEERQVILDNFGVTKYSRPYLIKDDCQLCQGTGYHKEHPYTSNPLLTVDMECDCAYE